MLAGCMVLISPLLVDEAPLSRCYGRDFASQEQLRLQIHWQEYVDVTAEEATGIAECFFIVAGLLEPITCLRLTASRAVWWL